MRRRIQTKSLHKAFLYKKSTGVGNTKSYSDVGLMFKYDNYLDKKSVIVGEELIGNWQSTDEGRKIETRSSHEFKRDDRVTIDGARYIINAIDIEEDSRLKKGAIRNRANVNITILTLT